MPGRLCFCSPVKNHPIKSQAHSCWRGRPEIKTSALTRRRTVTLKEKISSKSPFLWHPVGDHFPQRTWSVFAGLSHTQKKPGMIWWRLSTIIASQPVAPGRQSEPDSLLDRANNLAFMLYQSTVILLRWTSLPLRHWRIARGSRNLLIALQYAAALYPVSLSAALLATCAHGTLAVQVWCRRLAWAVKQNSFQWKCLK